LRVRYVEEDFGTNFSFNYTGEQLISRLNREFGQSGQGLDAREVDQLDGYLEVNASVFFDPADNFRLTLAVNNLFNRQGQEYFGELLPVSYDDLIGRRYSVSARVTF
jgi:outer membrane receptor protein involved in Fe transport